MFLQRMPRTDTGNVFDYTSYVPGGRLVKLSPPAADGKLTVLTSDPMFANADIMAYDLSFDAKSVVFSAQLSDGDNYNLFSMNLDGTNLEQLTEGDNDYVYPIYLPGQKILFTTNKSVEADASQFHDEYERADHRAGRHHQHRRHRRDARAAQRLAPRVAGAAARRPRASTPSGGTWARSTTATCA